MAATKTGNATHDAATQVAEVTRQAAVAAATTQAQAKTADISFYRTCLASALANNCGATQFIRALQELGTGGS